MTDLVTRLLLYTQNFDNNIEKSSRRLAQYKQTGLNASSAFSKLGGTVVKFAGALGIATTAGDALKTMFTHNDKLADTYQRTMEQAKTATTSFLTSLASGNLGSFLANFGQITKSAREAYEAMDALNTFKTGTTIEMSNLNTAYQIQLNLAKDRTLAEKERLVHLENAKRILKDQTKLMIQQMKLTQTAYQAKWREQMNAYGGTGSVLTQDFAREAFENWSTVGPKVQEFVNTYDAAVSKYKKIISDNTRTVSVGGGATANQLNAVGRKAQMELEALVRRNGEYRRQAGALLDIANNPSQEVLDTMQLKQTANSYAVAISNAELEVNRTESRITGTGGGHTGGVGNKEVVYAEGTTGWYDREIKKLQEESKNATAERLAEIDMLIAQYNAEKKALEFSARIIGWKSVEKEMENKGIAMPGQNLSVTKSPKMDVYMTAKMNKDLADKFAELKTNPVPVNNGAGVDKMQLTIDAINATAAALSSLNEEFDKSVAGILKWVSTLLSASAQAVKAIIAVTAAKSAESAAETPVVGWLMAAGAAASVMAALTALCSFAQGGIVPGSEYSGDRVLARVNSGEMILNRAQQANLFKMLNNGRGGEVGSNFGGRVVFEIRGDQLRGVLDNHDNRSRKIS